MGCGSGILSIFSIKAGASHVYAIENSEIYHFAKQIIKDNKFEDKISIYQGAIEEIILPVDKVDIIVSDWMGCFLLYESNIENVIKARDKWLKKEGLILPDKAMINLAAIEDYQFKDIKINFWREVDGINMTPVRSAAISEVLTDTIEKRNIISSVYKIFEIDLYEITDDELDFVTNYELKIIRDDSMHAFITWFDVHFSNLPHPVNFNTSPYNEQTHWKQCIMYLDNEYAVHQGDLIKGSFALRRSLINKDHLDIKFSVHKDEINFIQLFKFR